MYETIIIHSWNLNSYSLIFTLWYGVLQIFYQIRSMGVKTRKRFFCNFSMKKDDEIRIFGIKSNMQSQMCCLLKLAHIKCLIGFFLNYISSKLTYSHGTRLLLLKRTFQNIILIFKWKSKLIFITSKFNWSWFHFAFEITKKFVFIWI